MRVASSLIALLASATVASAETWTDPTSTITLDRPAGWAVSAQPTEGLTYIGAASATSECHIVGVPRAQTAEQTPYHVRFAAETPIDAALWTNVTNVFPDLFPGAVTTQSVRVDTESFWPMQRADFAVAGAPNVHAAIQFRPGLELWALCRTHSGAEETAAFDAIFRSIGTPNDAALQETAELQREAAEEHARGAREFNARARRPETPYRGPDAGIASGPRPTPTAPQNQTTSHVT